jgi:hypothetical protein
MLDALFPHGVILVFFLFVGMFILGALCSVYFFSFQTKDRLDLSLPVICSLIVLIALVLGYLAYHLTGLMVFR